MHRAALRLRSAVPVLALLFVAAYVLSAEKPPASGPELQKHFADGNWKDAYDGFRARLLEPAQVADYRAIDVVEDEFSKAIGCLERLGRVEEIDEFREAVAAAHAKSPRVLWRIASSFRSVQHQGYRVAGEFHRGHHRGGGEWIDATARDRVRALQLMGMAAALPATGEAALAIGPFYLDYAAAVLESAQGLLAGLTDLDELPDYETGWYHRGDIAAPVDEAGNPIFHALPADFASARSDGERWRWLLQMAMEGGPGYLAQARFAMAQFLEQQFGVETLSRGIWRPWEESDEDDEKDSEAAAFALHTLAEDETIARLASGVRRFKLPESHNPIRIYRELTSDTRFHEESAWQALAQIFENRRQFSKALECWRKCGEGDWVKQRISQLAGNWGRFEPHETHVAGEKAKVAYRFRNGTKVRFRAWRVDVDDLLAETMAYIKDKPRQFDWQKLQLENLGHRLVVQNEDYLDEEVATWEEELTPRAAHFDRRIIVTTPIEKAGVYLLRAEMKDGNENSIVLWVNDLAIAQKSLDGGNYCYIADAASGAPVAGATVEFFGYDQRHRDGREYEIDIKHFAETTDAEGQVVNKALRQDRGYRWLTIARTKDGRLAYSGFDGHWYGHYHDPPYSRPAAFGLTDRPLYRPGQPVKFKFWLAHASYMAEGRSPFAGAAATLRILNPRGEQVAEKSFTADAYGGFDGEHVLPEGAMLGVYTLHANASGGGNGVVSFRVEEYKKPEFEVLVDAPKEPIELGGAFAATIRARYYFGAPVTEGTVRYKVFRSANDDRWYPICRWDWLYGRGYGWCGIDWDWYPGWRFWGCRRPIGWWWGRNEEPPEIVAEGEAKLAADGSFKVTIDTASAKAQHGDTNHEYRVSAEVVDASRRTVAGTGRVVAAAKPFSVYVWLDRGYLSPGEEVTATFGARTPDGNPLAARGEAQLYRIRYDAEGKPAETALERWPAETPADGEGSRRFTVKEAGQYRFAVKLEAAGKTIEGAVLFTVVGADVAATRFAPLELLADRPEYRPGDKLKLLINTERADSTVLLFLRPVNGAYARPEVLRLAGKSRVVEVPVELRDTPNFFVEAITIQGGKLYSEMREIIVPPEKRIVNVAVEPSAAEYLPGAEGQIAVRLTDLKGNPFVGSTVLAVYDKALEAISGGSNVTPIHQFFWGWKRRHYPATRTSIERHAWPVQPENTVAMENIGLFGDLVAEEQDKRTAGADGYERRRKGDASGRETMGARSAPASAAKSELSLGEARDEEKSLDQGAQEGEALVEAAVRTKLADAALWVAAIETDRDGRASVSVTMPENLTTWKVKAWALGEGTRVGEGEAEVITRKNLLVRMQAPRFFTERDEVVLSANVHNYLAAAKRVKVDLELPGPELQFQGDPSHWVEIAAGAEARVDWRVRVARTGTAVVRMVARSDEESDALEMRSPVHEHGILKTDSISGAVRPEADGASFALEVPALRRVNDSRLEIRYSPTLAGAMVDALPYLIAYPYGCTEQTLNRFLPAAITQKVLRDMGLDLAAIRDKRTNLNAQEIGEDRERAAQWKRFQENPVFDEEMLRDIVKAGVDRLLAMQLSDGGWGWFSGYGEYSSAHTTATVVRGLQVAAAEGVTLVPGMLERGLEWLARYQAEQIRQLVNAATETKPWKPRADDLESLVFIVLESAARRSAEMERFLVRDRVGLSLYAKAMLVLTFHKLGNVEQVALLRKNIEQFLVQDEENQTAWLDMAGGPWWYWYGAEFETHAYALKMYSILEPNGVVAARLAKYLLNNRKHATYWNSTRDTALCIEALAEFQRASGEDRPDMVVEIWMDGAKMKEEHITSANLFQFDNRFVLIGDAVEDGKHTVEVRRRGRGPVYFNAYLTYFTQEEGIPAAGLEVKVERKLYRLVPIDAEKAVRGDRGQVISQKVEKYRREELANLASIESGTLVEVELEIESKNDYEYLVFEDLKGAGFEPVQVQSGYGGNALGAYMELRDRHVGFFVRQLARGRHSIAYRLRAETPGNFSALPTLAYAMYAPELRGNSAELRLNITERSE